MSVIGETEVKKCIIGEVHLVHEIPGYSAYEIAVLNGFKGTQAEWLASLKGPKGDIGTMESHSDIDAQGHRVTNMAEPTEDTDGATKKYADDKDAETKQYVDETYGTNEVDLDVFGKRVYGLLRGNTGIYKMGNLITGNIRLKYDHEFVNVGDVIIELREAYKPAYSFRVVDTSLGLSLLFDAASCSIVADSHTGGKYEDLELEFNFTYICE